MDAAEPTPAAPHPQFDFADSDFVLQSSDNVLFRVHKANLGAFSAVFRNMFGDAEGQATAEPVPVAETSSTLEILLAMCYPAEEPPVDFTTLDARVVLACYEATVKYQMWVAGLALRSFVQPLVHLEPFLVAKLAHRLNDSALMTATAEETLKCDILAKSQEYAEKAGPTVWPALLEFHYRRRMEIVVFASTSLAQDRISSQVKCPYCSHNVNINQAWTGLVKGLLNQGGATLNTTPFLKCITDWRFAGAKSICCSSCGNNVNASQQAIALDPLADALNNFAPKSTFLVPSPRPAM
ncbi:hypothetical protein AURDEDRAFT_185944 [Auricularia subglabra TFB-10046 SS5]|nr:hypothetical protein AURDEDRAFT_185944 [Auricularia subglabra TFB-10046 SS5]